MLLSSKGFAQEYITVFSSRDVFRQEGTSSYAGPVKRAARHGLGLRARIKGGNLQLAGSKLRNWYRATCIF
jgi:hypothetical protein